MRRTFMTRIGVVKAWCLLGACASLFISLVSCGSVAMAEGGGYISSDTTQGNGGGVGGVGGSPSTASWFFYSYEGNNEGESVKFLPIAYNVDNINSAVTISGECAKKSGGFWHFGRTDGSSGTLDCGFRNGGPCGAASGNYFNMSPGSYYHSQTINQNTWNSYWAYSNPAPSNIRHEIYNNDELKYKATESSSNPWGDNGSESAVTKAYQQACKYSGRTDCDNIPNYVSYFCWWEGMKEKTMTVYARINSGTQTGKFLNKDGNGSVYVTSTREESTPVIGPIKKPAGDPVELNSNGIEFDGYTFANWGIKDERQGSNDMKNLTWSTHNTDRKITWRSLTEDKDLDLYYDKNTFQGLSRVRDGGANGTVENTTGYVQASSHAGVYAVSNCPTSGCEVTFQHYLKRVKGKGHTTYSIKRTTSSIPGSSTGTVKNVATETFSGGEEVLEREQSYTLYPGQIVCETLIFNADIDTVGVKTTVCASANATVDGGQAIGLKVRNNSVDKWKEYQTEVWAKPGDELYYRATYTPSRAQVSHTATPDKYSLNGGTTSPSGTNRNTSQLGSLSAIGWKNAFNLSISFKSAYNHDYTYTKGDTTAKTEAAPITGHKVGANETGMSLDGLAKLNNVSAVKNTPAKVEFSTISEILPQKSSDTDSKKVYYTKANVVTETPESSAYARVPHNFDNTTVVDTCDKDVNASCPLDQVAYAGEAIPIKYHYYVNPKSNSLTTDGSSVKYATTVYNPKWKLTLCVTGGACYSTSERTANQFDVSVNKMYQTLDKYWTESLNVPDVPAGTEICVYSSIYPATSGADNNYTDKKGSNSWRDSEKSCFIVAKKPSIQIWGGNVYSGGAIATLESKKMLLAGYDNYRVEGGSLKGVFGSWGELGVFANGKITSFGSGASMGYASVDGNGNLTPNQTSNSGTPSPGGSGESGVCYHSPLTFANFYYVSRTCNDREVPGNMGDTVTASTMDGDKEGVLVKYDYEGDGRNYGTINSGDLSDASRLKGGVVYYYANDGDINVGSEGAVRVEKKTVQIVRANKGNIAISSDIIYDDADGGYNKLSDVPKLILYADGDIRIGCGVTRIDAVLIAEGTVSTCVDSTGREPELNSGERSQGQLVINGAVIAAKLKPLRTYGAATGANSIVPAEIINFDPTLYRWGGEDPSSSSDSEDGEESSVETSIDLDVTYQRELAPRL